MHSKNHNHYRTFGLAILAAVAALTVMAFRSHAAEVRVVETKYCHAVLHGVIEKGDAKKVARIFSDQNIDWEKRALCLDSPGGSYGEAVKIMKTLIDRTSYDPIGTVVDKGMTCQYACAIAFLGGASLGEEDRFRINRALHEEGVLAFGLPPLSDDPQRNASRDDLEISYTQSVEVISELLSISFDRFWDPSGVSFIPYDFLSRVLASKPGELIPVTRGKDLEDMKIEYHLSKGGCWMAVWGKGDREEYKETPTCKAIE
ncbi:MAG: hypothetical protein KJ558_05855 [Gammaproteobacteria bacterium]|nr:hypothetical protein [Gammaproteobacteria bacterium]MBU1654341.1 hypothetical protein [Gammaproteobacteria bacterium]MBU1962659.1 hypothetical protein [Gammaproteobacteria bacterium]